jgi:hypothetical protein
VGTGDAGERDGRDSIELCDQLGALGSPSRRQPATDAIC